jgi:hypothetical protein
MGAVVVNIAALVVFALVTVTGVALELVGRLTSPRCPTISHIARAVHRRRFGGWLLFAMWAAVGWHLFSS